MPSKTTRRALLFGGSQTALIATLISGSSVGLGCQETQVNGGGAEMPWLGFPRQDQKLVAAIVGVSHFNEHRVKELLAAYPEFVNVSWDWGFGDWETPLGAASHTGQRGIAETLLSHGARIDIFAAAMLGFTSVVKAFVDLQPGIQRTLGPHGITLLSLAKAGEKRAADTVDYLISLGDADIGLKVTPVPVNDRTKYLGSFASDTTDLKLAYRLNKAELLVIDVQTGQSQSNNRIIHYVGGDEFFPAGVPSVRIRFLREQEILKSVTIRGSVPEITLQHVGS